MELNRLAPDFELRDLDGRVHRLSDYCERIVVSVGGGISKPRSAQVLKDVGHIVADAYAAQVTPEVFVVDRTGVIRDRGAVDDTSFRQRVPTRSYLEEAVDALLAGRLPTVTEVPAFGCSIIRES